MERGLLWLPLLITFFWLVWSGSNEYQKIELYKKWAEEFDSAKYDIYSVLAHKGKIITWGKPSSKEIKNLQSFSLDDVETISLLINDEIITSSELPKKGKPFIQFNLKNSEEIIKIPFTEIALTAQWVQYLTKLII